MDEGKGTVRCYWENIRERVSKVEPNFFNIVDKLHPDKSLPIYLVYLPYGSLKGDNISSFMPNMDGSFVRLTDTNLSSVIISELGYGKNSSPFGMVLEKELEYFIEIEQDNIIIPSHIHKAGAFFNYSIILNEKNGIVYAPNGILKASSGCRSVFMLPNIGCMTHHYHLQREYNIQSHPPKKINDHWHTFKSILSSSNVSCHWSSCLVYFSESWVRKLWEDPSWLELKLYLLEKERKISEHQRFHQYYDIIFSLIQKNRNLKPNPYLVDTVRHIFNIALGIYPGFIPATNDDSLPLNLLQNVYVNSYGMDKYTPTIMKPDIFDFLADKNPIYYSLQQPTTYAFSPKSRSISSALSDMRGLMHLIEVFCKELGNNSGLCTGTIFENIAQKIIFSYFHNKKDLHSLIELSSNIVDQDHRFRYLTPQVDSPNSMFAVDAKFFRGCISISV